MEGDRSPQRPLRRDFESHRLEAELQGLAYETLWPVIARRLVAAAPAVVASAEETCDLGRRSHG